MARRIPLPRLTHRQRMARWQRDRRQQVVIVTVFAAVLVSVLGLAMWAAASGYYDKNLVPAARVAGLIIPQREFEQQKRFELVRIYVDYGVPVEAENDPQLAGLKASYADVALDKVIEHRVLDRAAEAEGIAVTADQVDQQYDIEYGELRVRHILVSVPTDAEKPEVADANAQAKARAISAQLRSDPSNADLWKSVAAASSDDTGTKSAGGELGWSSSGRYVPVFGEAIRTLPVGQISDPVKTQFGWHVVQVEEQRPPSESDYVKRYLSSGFSERDLKYQARYEALRSQFEKRAQAEAVVSPAEQVHLAKIVVNIPQPTSTSDFQAFGEALQKQTDVKKVLDEGKDFAEVAKEKSEDTETAEKGGDMGWVARGMITLPRAEDAVFSTAVGQQTEPISTNTDWTVYKVLEKETRELTADQKTKLKQSAFEHWLQRQKIVYGSEKLVPGLALE